MIIVKLIGGLGNQLFQYAFGRHLSQIYNTEIKIDISPYEEYKLHKYSLWAFNIIEDFADGQVINKMTYFKEKKFEFQNEFNDIKDNFYIDGYWQSEKYFYPIRDILLKEISVKNNLTGKNLEIASLMKNTESVSVHLRLGDYVKGTYSEQIFDSCPLDYYGSCIEHLTRTVKNPVFFVFSDDMQWVKENFRIPFKVYYMDNNNVDTNYEDLRLMSLSRHNIIANSSFSWWGAWLNTFPDKIIYAPRHWFNQNARNTSVDLIPDSWIRL